jgi:hypothetical protein
MLDHDRRLGHLAFFCVRLVEAVFFAPVAAGFRTAADLEAGLATRFGGSVFAACAAPGSSSIATGSTTADSGLATETELDSVR